MHMQPQGSNNGCSHVSQGKVSIGLDATSSKFSRVAKDGSVDLVGPSSNRALKKTRMCGEYQNGTDCNLDQNGFENHVYEDGACDKPSASRDLTSSELEIVRLIGQHLHGLGLKETVATLIRESNCKLEHPAAFRFRENVLKGRWDLIDQDLKNLQPFLNPPERTTEMKFMLLEQKYLELLDASQLVEALMVLREELTPLKFNTERVHELSTLLMYNSTAELRQMAKWEGSSTVSRQKLIDRLQVFLPPSVMLPPRRLEALLQQAISLQKERCPLHNTLLDVDITNASFLSDHLCTADTFPCRTRQVLTEHCDEVWFLQFSPNGRYLASGSKEPTVLIWEVDPTTMLLNKKHALEGHQSGAGFIAWSADSKCVAVVAPDDVPDLWIWNVETGELRVRMTQQAEDCITCVSWHPESQRLVCGGTKGQFYLCDVAGNVVDSWEGVRIRSLWFKSDGRTVYAADTHNRLRSYTFDDQAAHTSDKTIFKEEHNIMNFTMDSSERFALISLANQGLHLWDLESRCLVRRYRGVTQGYFTIFACFGGVNQQFIASGSEDNNVYIWHIDKEKPVSVLSGHAGLVNATSWNPVYPSMLASCSDDGTVRIWGPAADANDSSNADQKSMENVDDTW